ncbi:uncharacterized protein LOC100202102 isoform X2 [Hydra vulgaris]|uniref:uncharacterized protein LOC100202102 isoform X2 n=1 Tax=Hydra vulgaris TaxID=6087 RepID=UPI0032EA5CBB
MDFSVNISNDNGCVKKLNKRKRKKKGNKKKFEMDDDNSTHKELNDEINEIQQDGGDKMAKKKSKKKKKEISKMDLDDTNSILKDEDITINMESEQNGNNYFIEVRGKKKKKEHPPSIIFDIDELFSLGGKRAMNTSLNISDIRTLLLSATDPNFTVLPNWCQLKARNRIKRSLFIMVSGVSEDDFKNNMDCFPFLTKNFEKHVPVRNDGSDNMIKSPLESYLMYTISKKILLKQSIKKTNDYDTELDFHDYILSDFQLKVNDYPEWNSAALEHGIISTRKNNEVMRAHKNSKLLAIDCEMCSVMGDKRALTRVSIVDDKLNLVYDQLVQPDSPITDYLTQFSGITPAMLHGVTTTLQDVQRDLLKIIQPDTILIGHSLDFDLRSLMLHHDNIIDTSVLYVDNRGPRYKSSLRCLVKSYLNRDIQNTDKGHCSIEDARACMELVKLKIKKGPSFGNPLIDKESIFDGLTRAGKRGVILDLIHIVRQYANGNNHGIACTSDDQVASNGKKIVNTVDFTFCNFRSYEQLLKSEVVVTEKEQKETLRKIDEHISEVVLVAEPSSIVVIALSNGFIPSKTMRLLRDKEQRNCDEVKNAVKKAKQGACFLKITR